MRAPGARESDDLDGQARGVLAAQRFVGALGTYRGVIAILVGLVILFSILQPGFRTTADVQNIVETNAVLLIVSIGLTFPMLNGGFDLSIAGVDALAGIFLVKLLIAGVPLWASVIVVVVGSILFGAIGNGILIGYLNVNFFIVTLGTLTIAQSLSLQLTGGAAIGMYSQHVLTDFGSGQLGPIPDSGIIAAAVVVLAICALRYTGFGRMVYAVGGNPEAARLAGISAPWIRMLTYAVSSGLAGIGGIIEVGRLQSASPTTDSTIELTAAAAVLIGGVAFGGGVGTILGTLLGVAFLGVLQSGLLISGLSSYWQGVITGVVLIGSVSLDKLRTRSGGRPPDQRGVFRVVDRLLGADSTARAGTSGKTSELTPGSGAGRAGADTDSV